jgi:hypothetical protein
MASLLVELQMNMAVSAAMDGYAPDNLWLVQLENSAEMADVGRQFGIKLSAVPDILDIAAMANVFCVAAMADIENLKALGNNQLRRSWHGAFPLFDLNQSFI